LQTFLFFPCFSPLSDGQFEFILSHSIFLHTEPFSLSTGLIDHIDLSFLVFPYLRILPYLNSFSAQPHRAYALYPSLNISVFTNQLCYDKVKKAD